MRPTSIRVRLGRRGAIRGRPSLRDLRISRLVGVAIAFFIAGVAMKAFLGGAYGIGLRPTQTMGTSSGVVFEIRSIFGDHIAGAEVDIEGKKGVTDDFGVVSFTGLPSGSARAAIVAEGYRKVGLDLQLTPGKNQVVFRNESGLRPDSFRVDFHVFWNTTSGGVDRGIAEIIAYNGSSKTIYLIGCDIRYPDGVTVSKVLESADDYGSLILSHSSADVVLSPRPAIRIAPDQIVYADPIFLSGPPVDGSTYTLTVTYTADLSDPSDRWTADEISDLMDFDGDWDPHVP